MATQTQTFDFGSVSVEDAELPKATRARRTGPNPFTEPLAASYESKTGKAVTVPGKAVKDANSHLRRAANDLNIGVRIVFQNSKGETLKYDAAKDSKGNVTIKFQGQDRKQRKQSDSATDAA